MNSLAAKPLAAAAIAQLESDGVATLIGTVVNPAGLIQAKTVPLRRMGIFADPGLGASPVFHAFTIDQTGIVFSDAISVVGDQRIRIDLGALRILGDGLAWAPGGFFNQDGSPDPYCGRGVLQRVQDRLATAEITALVGHELPPPSAMHNALRTTLRCSPAGSRKRWRHSTVRRCCEASWVTSRSTPCSRSAGMSRRISVDCLLRN